MITIKNCSASQGRARTKSTVQVTPKSRLAGCMGLVKPPVGRTIPMVKGQRQDTMETQRSDLGVSALSIFGNWNDLDNFR